MEMETPYVYPPFLRNTHVTKRCGSPMEKSSPNLRLVDVSTLVPGPGNPGLPPYHFTGWLWVGRTRGECLEASWILRYFKVTANSLFSEFVGEVALSLVEISSQSLRTSSTQQPRVVWNWQTPDVDLGGLIMVITRQVRLLFEVEIRLANPKGSEPLGCGLTETWQRPHWIESRPP